MNRVLSWRPFALVLTAACVLAQLAAPAHAATRPHASRGTDNQQALALIVLAFVLALLADRARHGRWFFRLAFFMPFILPSAVVGLIEINEC